MTQDKTQIENFGKVKWKCRRGMLELDIMLQLFFDNNYSNLSTQHQINFNRLLDETDPVLYQWLLGFTVPEDKELAQIVKIIINWSRTTELKE